MNCTRSSFGPQVTSAKSEYGYGSQVEKKMLYDCSVLFWILFVGQPFAYPLSEAKVGSHAVIDCRACMACAALASNQALTTGERRTTCFLAQRQMR
jgi:hypothetical protein